TINADTVGGTIQLVGTGSLINQGTITATAGTLSLNGNLTLAGLGTISSRGGPVNLVGTLDLGGGTLTLNNATGSWNLVGGTLRNGTLSESSGALLVYTSTGGVLTNVT